MRITTWNVNGIRNPFGYQPWSTTRTFPAMFDILEADIVIMQELKIQRKDLTDDMVLLDGWDCYFSLPKHKKGYSGVGIYTRNSACAPIRAEEGVLGVLTPPNSSTAFRDLPDDQHIGGYPTLSQISDLGVDPLMLDSEGRCVCLEFPAFVIFGVYSPANSNGLRDDFRYGFLCALDCRIRNLVKAGKQVILCGDLNVSRNWMDTASATEDMRKAGITNDEYVSTPNRRVFNQLIFGGEVIGERDPGREEPILHDLAREFHPDRKGMYTHWEQKVNARPGNFGSRIDFVLVSAGLREWFCASDIQEGLMGSDHCPVYGVMKDKYTHDGQECHFIDFLHPAGTFEDGVRQRPWVVKEVPPCSGKLLPEFDKRRSIKDMFSKPTQAKPAAIKQNVTSNGTNGGPRPNTTSSNGASSTTGTTVANAVQTISRSSTNDKKRKISDSHVAPLKRTKSATNSPAKAPDTTKAQSSLKGFFAPKTKPATETRDPSPTKAAALLPGNEKVKLPPGEPATTCSLSQRVSPGASPATPQHITPAPASLPSSTASPPAPSPGAPDPLQAAAQSPQKPATLAPPPESPTASQDADEHERVHDPIEAKESWTHLFRRPAAPLCEHDQPCKVMLTKKKGENQGRSFWMCTRPLGPSGAKERGSQWRCPTFIWCSDLKGDGA